MAKRSNRRRARSSSRTAKPNLNYCPAQDDPHDEIPRHILRLWIDTSLLINKLCGQPDVAAHEIMATALRRRPKKKPRQRPQPAELTA